MVFPLYPGHFECLLGQSDLEMLRTTDRLGLELINYVFSSYPLKLVCNHHTLSHYGAATSATVVD